MRARTMFFVAAATAVVVVARRIIRAAMWWSPLALVPFLAWKIPQAWQSNLWMVSLMVPAIALAMATRKKARLESPYVGRPVPTDAKPKKESWWADTPTAEARASRDMFGVLKFALVASPFLVALAVACGSNLAKRDKPTEIAMQPPGTKWPDAPLITPGTYHFESKGRRFRVVTEEVK